jgi:phage tail-like protein
MIPRPTERLYNLLPAIFRLRDADSGEQLRAFMLVLEDVLRAVENDIDELYENWFIQTCDESTVPYIADLVDVRGLTLEQRGYVRQRALVANAIAHRRRKGTVETLEHVARDATGWDARAVELRRLVATTPSLRHWAGAGATTVDVRRGGQLEWLGSPYDTIGYTADLRSAREDAPPQRRPGRPSVSDVGLFLWRLQSYPVVRATPFCVGPGRYTFNPLGHDAPLFGYTRTMRGRQRSTRESVAHPLPRLALAEELEARRSATVEGRMPSGPYFDRPAAFEIWVEGRDEPVPPEEVVIGDLSDWRPPAREILYPAADGGAPVVLPITAAVDPVLGRLTCAPGVVLKAVSYCYGFSGDVGGGPYDRHQAVERGRGHRHITWQCGVGGHLRTVRGEPVFATLAEAIRAWNQLPPGETGLIAIADSATYGELPEPFVVRAGSTLLVVAGGWPVVDWDGGQARLLGQVVPEIFWPCLRGDLRVQGVSFEGDARAGQLVLDGLLVDGRLEVLHGGLGRLRIYDTTLVPGRGGLVVGSGNEALAVELQRSVVDAVRLAATVPELSIVDCVVHDAGCSIEAPGASALVRTSTVFGPTTVAALTAADSIFVGRVEVERRQHGSVETSYLPPDSATPRRVRCQPELGLSRCATAAEEARTRARLVPAFTSTLYGDPAYAQLVAARAPEIANGASNESEMGVFNHLLQPLRHAHLKAALEEFLPTGFQAGIFYVT